MKRALGVLLMALCWSAAGFAQTAARAESTPPGEQEGSATQADAERARDLGHAGLNAYGQGDFERALDLFHEAEALAHSPVFRLYAARCLLALERTEEGRAELEAILATTPSEGVPDAWLRARRSAEDELAALPTSTSDVPSDAPADFDADGRVVSIVNAEALPPSPPPAPAPAHSFWNRATPEQRGAFVAFGVGAVGLVFSAITGGIALAETAAIKANCMNNVCPPEDLPRAEYATQMANLATVGASVALAGGVTGTVLWLLPGHDRGVALSVAGPSLRLEGRF